MYRVVSFFPYVIPAIAIGLIWQQIFNPQSGLLNSVLLKFGFSGFKNFAWLGEIDTARWAVMFVIVWGFVGFYMVLFVASIKGVPAELYEAARIDGAGRLVMTFKITIPLIRESVQTAWIYLGIMALDAFVYAQALAFEGGPLYSTRTMSQVLFKTVRRRQGRPGERHRRLAGDHHVDLRQHVFGEPLHRWQGSDSDGMSDVAVPAQAERTQPRRSRRRHQRARRPDHLVADRHRSVGLDVLVVVQDQRRDLPVAVEAAQQLGSRQLPHCGNDEKFGSHSSTRSSSSARRWCW